MDYYKYLGMKLDVVLEHLRLNSNELEVLYTVPPRFAFRGETRILKAHSVGDKLVLTVSYQTGREGGV